MIDVTEYIGLPYQVEARGPTHYDCWGIIRLVYRERLGIELPTYTGYAETMTPHTAGMINEGRPGWSPVNRPEPYDVVLFNVNGAPNHIGLVIAPDLMLHTTNKTDACIENFRRPLWVRRMESIYRYDHSTRPPSPAA